MTWIQTSRGRAFDLLHPRPEDVDFEEIASALAETPRFAGHVPGYVIAQHCTIGAVLLRSWGDREAALHFHLRDGHEYVIGDPTIPFIDALDELTAGVGYKVVSSATAILKARIDGAIFKAAGLVNRRDELVKQMDRRMLRTERDQLLGPSPMPWADVYEQAEPLPIKIKVVSRAQAARDWLDLFCDLSPNARALGL